MEVELLAEARRLHHARRFTDAEQLCRRVLQQRPGDPDALYRLARIAQTLGQLPVATALLKRAVAARPDSGPFRKVLGDILQAQGKPLQAVKEYERVLKANPVHAEARHNLAIALLQAGQPEQAVARLREAVELAPQRSELHSNLLLALQYAPRTEPGEIFDEAGRWGTRHAFHVNMRQYANAPDPQRRLRVGYVSTDFRQHPVGLFLEPVLNAHNRAQVEVFCYSNAWTADDVTARLRSAADHWRSIAGVADEDVDRLVMSDRIDVLVDLSGHTAANRLTLFSRKPAPVQATWAGYSGTTGLQTVDYFIGDSFICLEGDERYFTERVIRLPDYFLAYMPNPCAPSISPAPVLSTGYVTFGCFNTLAKVNTCVVAVWSEILTQVPGARLHLKTDALLDSEVRDRYLALFGAHNISADRLILQPRSTSWNEYANTFAAIDIALDPFPFNGGTTSMDGLWMGVPLVTLQGKRCVGRFGSGILSTMGLTALVADTPEHYIKTSVTLASDPQRLAGLRATLRQRMADSPLCDTRALTRALEAAYRSMWRTWCDPQRAN